MKQITETLICDTTAMKRALLRAFPTRETFFDFKEKDKTVSRAALPKFLSALAALGHLPEPTDAAFVKFIQDNSRPASRSKIQLDLSFQDVIHELKGDKSVNWFIKNLNYLSKKLGMPEYQAPMFSRLKKEFRPDTARKRGLLRIMAIWIGLMRPDYEWDYRTLLGIPSVDEPAAPAEKEKEGVRVDFTFQGRGEIVDLEMIAWLKTVIPVCIKDLKLFHLVGKQLTTYAATSVSLEIPKKAGPPGEPRLFDQAIRDALAISHQIILRWTLSHADSEKNAISIGIAAGEFIKLHIPLQTIVGTGSKQKAAIRVTDFVRICIRSTDVKISLSPEPLEVPMPDGDCLPIWLVNYFWPGYYDLPPNLMEKDVFPATHAAYRRFKQHLYQLKPELGADVVPLSLRALRRFPHKDLLGIEIAKTCLSRRMFHEANTILSGVLAANPYHPVARIIRMNVFMNLALEQTEPDLFDIFFERAVGEGKILLQYCQEDEEIFVEVGLAHFGKAAYLLNQIRRRHKAGIPESSETAPNAVVNGLRKALLFLEKGLSFSPTGNRSTFWIIHLRCLLRMLENDREMIDGRVPVLDRTNVYPDICQKIFFSRGWLSPDYFSNPDPQIQIDCLTELFQRTLQSVETYYSSMHFRVCRPNIAYAIASVLWDFSPILTVGIAKLALEWLDKAKSGAEELEKSKLGVYGIKAYYMQIQPAGQFITRVNKAVEVVHSAIGEDFNRDDLHPLDPGRCNGRKLYTMHFDIDIPAGVVL